MTNPICPWRSLAGLVSFLLFIVACHGTPGPAAATPARSPDVDAKAHIVPLTVLHMNDVYELLPIGGGAYGGLARVATLRRELRAKNSNTVTVLAGDLFSPSALGTAKVDGRRLAGRQMVDVMNALGLDYATFGNHEFDLSKDEFLARLTESKTTWTSVNAMDATGKPFPNVPTEVVFRITNAAGREARVGLFGVTLVGPSGYVTYADPLTRARTAAASLRPKVDILIAMTHLPLAADIDLARTVPGIDLVVAGHEHENIYLARGPRTTPIAKADANARTVYVHEIAFDARTRAVDVSSRLVPIGPSLAEDGAVASQANAWVRKAFDSFRAQGFDPSRVIAELPEPLDGTEASVRHRSTRLTELIGKGMLAGVPGADWAIFNSGAVRIDDVLEPGPVTEYDVLRTLPFGGSVVAVEMQGALLERVLVQGRKNAGNGGFLQVERRSTEPIVPDRTYLVAMADFLLTGRETELGFLTRATKGLVLRPSSGEAPDLRAVLIRELARNYPLPRASTQAR